MQQYQNGKIYKIVSGETDKIYIGSTISPLCKRISQHRDYKKRFEAGVGSFYSSLDILQYDDAHIVLVEDYPCENREQLQAREEYWLRQFKDIAVNRHHAKRTKKEYVEETKEQKHLTDKLYYEANKDVIREKKKEYYEANKDVIAEKKKEYGEANKDMIREKKKEYYKANKEAIAEKSREWREANKEAKREKDKEYYKANKEVIAEKTHEYYEKNKEHIKEYSRNWHRQNYERIKQRNTEKIQCECGRVTSRNNRSAHLKSPIHMELMAAKTEKTEKNTTD